MFTVNLYGEANFPNLEWWYLILIRFSIQEDENSTTVRALDCDLFQLGKHCKPIKLKIGDENVRKICIEMRPVHKVDTLIIIYSLIIHFTERYCTPILSCAVL